jgi:glucokinase
MTTPAGSAILADIGGTNARYALLVGTEIGPLATYNVADHASPVEAARLFLDGPAAGYAPRRALLAAAGPAENGRITLTNAGWTVDATTIREGLGLAEVRVLNDFEALAWALPALRADDLFTLGAWGPGERGTMAVMGPGSGFGLAALVLGPAGETALVTEGGHATLAGGNRREDAIILALREQLHHVSVERVLSGPCAYRKLDSAVLMVKATEKRSRCDGADLLDDALERSVLGQRSVGSLLVVVARIRGQDPAQMRFAQDHDMVQALSPD